MAKTWIKEYRKSKDRVGTLARFSDASTRKLVELSESDPGMLVQFLRNVDLEARRMAGLHVDFLPGWNVELIKCTFVFCCRNTVIMCDAKHAVVPGFNPNHCITV